MIKIRFSVQGCQSDIVTMTREAAARCQDLLYAITRLAGELALASQAAVTSLGENEARPDDPDGEKKVRKFPQSKNPFDFEKSSKSRFRLICARKIGHFFSLKNPEHKHTHAYSSMEKN